MSTRGESTVRQPEEVPTGPPLVASERRYKTLFDSIDQAFAVVEVLFDDARKPIDYRFLETNPAYLRHTALEDVTGKTGRELVPTLEPLWAETFGRVALTGEPERFTQPAQGMERWFDCYAFRFGDPRDHQVAVFFKDVTEQRLAEQRNRFLVALDDATRSLFEPEAIAATAARLLGEHLRTDRVAYSEVDDEAGFAVLGEWSRDVGPEILATAEAPFHSDGKLRSLLAVYQRSPRQWRAEELELVQTVANRAREAIESARVASRLRDSEEQFRTLASLLPQFIWTARPDGHIYWFNEYAHEFFGPTTPIEGSGWMRHHDPELLPEVERGYLEAVAAGSSYSCTTRFRNAAGEYRWFIARMLPQRDAHGRVLRFIGYNFDVTDLYETQARLVEADRRKDEFLATLAHELRNPLAPLYNLLEILKLQPGQGITGDLRDIMHRQIHHLGRLVDDLLDASRITRGVIELKRERVSLGDVLGAAVETSRPLIEARGHRLQIDAPERPLWLNGDAVRLTQIFANLLNNAAKYTDDGGYVGIRVSAEDGTAVVTVSDDGIGIAREMLARVFELFTQVDRHLGRAQGGLGIGLSLSRSLVEMHGGTLEAESDGIGRGSHFTVRLPLNEAEAPSDARRPDRHEPPPEKRAELLVVDDNVDAAESFGLLLTSLGFDVSVVHDGVAALALLERKRFAAAFIDLGMPGLDGLELARRIRGTGRSTGLRLIALTGWGQDEDRARSHQAGFDHHLVKPAEVEAVQAVLDELST